MIKATQPHEYGSKILLKPAEEMPASKLISFPISVLIPIVAGILSYHGAALRPILVPDAMIAAMTVTISLFLLLLPFTRITRETTSIFSPEAMGGIGYLIYIGVGATTNHIWPGLAVNPSLFGYLPVGILAQTAAAIAFYVGTQIAQHSGLTGTNRRTQPSSLAILMLVYAGFALYLSFFLPKVDAGDLLKMTRSGDSISWLLSVGPFILLQSLPMIIAAQAYLHGAQYMLIRYAITASLGFVVLIFLVSGSRTYAVQVMLLLFVAQFLARQTIRKTTLLVMIGAIPIILVLTTNVRLGGEGYVSFNPATTDTVALVERMQSVVSTSSTTEIGVVVTNLRDNIVYHLSDNQTMAMLISKYGRGPLLGRAMYNSLLSALPSRFLPGN